MFRFKNKKFYVEAKIFNNTKIHDVIAPSVESAFNKVSKLYSLNINETLTLKLIQ